MSESKEWTGGEVLFAGGTDWAMLGRQGGKKTDAQKELERQEKYPNLVEPHRLKGLTGVKVAFIAAGSAAVHCVAADINGVCYTWGRNERGQLGHGDLLQRNTPTVVAGLQGKKVVAGWCGRHHTAVVLDNGESWTFGLNSQGQLGTGSIKKNKGNDDLQLSPVKAAVSNVKSVSCGTDFTVWLTKEGEVYAAGNPQYGQLGDGSDHSYNAKDSSIKIVYEPQPTPKAVAGLLGTHIKQVTCGHTHSLALDDKGAAYTWGNGNYGKLGHKVQQDELKPRQIESFRGRILALPDGVCGAGGTSSFCMASGPQLYAWGKLKVSGDNTTHPMPLEDLSGWNLRSLSCGPGTFAVAADQSVITWGAASNGELGYGKNGKKSSARPGKVGTWYNTLQSSYTAATGKTWAQASNTAIYNNQQRATALWYHDHTLGLTHKNVYAGMAGFYLIRDRFPSIANGPELPGISHPAYDGVIPLNLVRELPLAIQDRSFTADSQLWYPVADNAPGTFLPNGPLHPRWIPEYTATVPDPTTSVLTNMLMMTVNGRTYPRHTTYPDAYRLRILNGCNSRTMQLRFARSTLASINPLSSSDTANLLPFWVIGSDDGFMPNLKPAMTTLQMGPAERYDVIIDFSRLQPGEFVYLLNNGPETDTALYDGTNNGVGLTVHTAQIMRFDITALPPGQVAQPFTLDRQVLLNNALVNDWAQTEHPIGVAAAPPRQVSLMEQVDPAGVPIAVLLGTATSNANGPNLATPTMWMDPVTTNSATSATSEWDIINLSADAHPMHLHHVDFEYRGRFALNIDPANPNSFTKTNTPVPNQDLDPLLSTPCTQEPSGVCLTRKDTVLVLPGSYTRIAFRAPALAGLYVWHCHLVEHEDNEMMVPHCFGQPGYTNPKTGLPMCPGPN